MKILREAYDEALSDPELLGRVKRSRLEMEPITGQGLEAIYNEPMDQRPAVIELVKRHENN